MSKQTAILLIILAATTAFIAGMDYGAKLGAAKEREKIISGCSNFIPREVCELSVREFTK